MAEEPEKLSCSASQHPSSSAIKPQNPDHGEYDEETNRGAGIYAVPVHHQFGALASNYLIPLTYKLQCSHLRSINSKADSFCSSKSSPGHWLRVASDHLVQETIGLLLPSNETEARGENQAQAGQGQQQQQPAHQRQVVVRRFEIAFQLDIFLILKLAAVIFLFNQDGSRQRLALLVIFATIIYLYQTGALAPFVRWLSQGMHRAAVPPPRPNRPAARPDNDPAAALPLNEDAVPEGQNEADNGNRANGNENVDAGHQENQWWGIVKEIQMIVFGFITSLLPGFQNID